LADGEALDRTRRFLLQESIESSEFEFAAAVGNHRPMRAIRSQSRRSFNEISRLIQWPLLPSLSWVKGFLAGIFDAQGSKAGVIRIANGDDLVVEWTVSCLGRLGLHSVVEHFPGRVPVVRLRGGLHAQRRFLLAVDPAITRKRAIIGVALKTNGGLRVKSIEPLDMVMRMYDITTGTGDFIANGVVSHNCFARPTHKYLDFDAGRDFEREIVVKVNAPERLRVELGKPSWTGEHIAMGTNTDPYQWVEGRYKLMRGIWQAMIAARNPSSILTKSPLLLRDLDLMQELNQVTDFGAALSVPTIDERAWRDTEPHTPNPRARLEAVAELTRAGIRTGVLVAPLMPGINDSPEQVAKILELADEAGAAYVSGIALHLRGDVRKLFMDWLRERHPDLVPRYSELYRRGAYAPASERRRLSRLVSGPDIAPWQRGRGSFQRGSRVGRGSKESPEPEPPTERPVQATLFD
jgi:DNA repair photolyase